jgi:RNA polymerase sigma factor (sigma-70 family)
VVMVQAPVDNDNACNAEMVGCRTLLAQAYATLPRNASSAFGEAVASAEIPLETLVKWLRSADRCEDIQMRTCILATILERTHALNEVWARKVLRHVVAPESERRALVDDLGADLSERMVQALLDPERSFWEENFLHCLRFERRHVYRSFMLREGRWSDPMGQKRLRIPRVMLVSLDQRIQQEDGNSCTFDVEDERAQAMLQAVERNDLLHMVLRLPDRLKAVILLIFWEDRSEKESARTLGVSERTVRNRLREALRLLHDTLKDEKEVRYG